MFEGCASVAEFIAKNPVTFVTYNYDRLVEYRLTSALKAHYHANNAQCADALQAIQTIHLHGSLGPLSQGNTVPFGAAYFDDMEQRRMNVDEALPLFIGRSAESIKIVHQADGNDAQFMQARESLGNAERVFFLGFGFGGTNVQRLRLQSIREGALVFTTSLGMTVQEFAAYVHGPMVNVAGRALSHPHQDFDCLSLLRTFIRELV